MEENQEMNSHKGSSFHTLFEELGEKNELESLTQKKISETQDDVVEASDGVIEENKQDYRPMIFVAAVMAIWIVFMIIVLINMTCNLPQIIITPEPHTTATSNK